MLHFLQYKFRMLIEIKISIFFELDTPTLFLQKWEEKNKYKHNCQEIWNWHKNKREE